ncbi:splicing factor 3A subunit 1 [Babesia gibsoni]|uniref:Splicing factor 3A subunit 1 n=1 Tax=Babesia gibsoni TaxID=33632 RepID=A0AAD8PFU8_BABGI|nr:splicing factor 3A subunit 1 [Babesia gibsoni]
MASVEGEVIFPPKYVRSIIDKTAQFVAKNGDQFEQRIRVEQGDDSTGSKFAFLNPNNAYNAYYHLKLSELKNGIDVEIKPSIPQAILDRRKKLELKNKSKERLLALTDFGSAGSADSLEEPEADTFSYTQPFVTAMDLDIIKSTAVFVARNGQKFLVELTRREKNNPQFDFLNPSHCLFGFFTSITEAYTKCLLPSKKQIEKLNTIAKENTAYLRLCQRRADWDAHLQAKAASEEMKKAEERMEQQSIDWHVFYIAETITFSENPDELPPSIDFSHPGASLILMTRNPRSIASAMKSEEKLQASIPEDVSQINPEEPVIPDESYLDDTTHEELTPDAADRMDDSAAAPKFSDAPEGYKRRVARDNEVSIVQDGDEIIKVKKSYTRKSKTRGSTEMQKCPITGQMVPASEMSTHLKILLLDPKWKDQKERFLEKAMKESAFAPMEDVDGNLASFVAGRPDLFGSADDETLDHTS